LPLCFKSVQKATKEGFFRCRRSSGFNLSQCFCFFM